MRRLPRAPNRKRPQKFWDGFEDRALIYDCFWHEDESRILLVCPPPGNLEPHWQEAKFIALPSRTPLEAAFHDVRSTMTVSLTGAPEDTGKILMEFAGEEFIFDVQPNLSGLFENARVLFTMSQNNPLAWIAEWARFHQVMHGADAVILFDNGSSAYAPEQLEQTLAKVPGIKKVLVISWPYKYGPHDPGVIFHRFWANFLQVSSFTVVLRRLAGRAYGLLNVDIDELAGPVAGTDVFELARQSPDGLYRMLGNWVESIIEPGVNDELPLHSAYRYMRRDIRHRLNAKKWSLDPTRQWLQDLDVHPSVHRVMNMPKEMARRAPRGLFWHFKGINTNWKQKRRRSDLSSAFIHRRPARLDAMFRQYQQRLQDRD